MSEPLTVHGSIVFLLKKFIDQSLPYGSWEVLMEKVGLKNASIELTWAYPLETIEAIINAASKTIGLPVEELKEKFGEQIVPDLFRLYKHYLQPEWRTYQILLNTEEVMHGAVRKLNSTANPPVLNVSKVSQGLLIIDYYSKRKMGSLAVGIIRGIAKYYGEQNEVTVESLSASDAERVQIKVHFARKTNLNPDFGLTPSTQAKEGNFKKS